MKAIFIAFYFALHFVAAFLGLIIAIHLMGQLKVILETIIYLQSEQLKIQKQIDKLKQKEDK